MQKEYSHSACSFVGNPICRNMTKKYISLVFTFSLLVSATPRITAQVAPPYSIVDIGSGMPLAVASNGTVVISLPSSTSPYRYRAGVYELLSDGRDFQFADMNDKGDIVGTA